MPASTKRTIAAMVLMTLGISACDQVRVANIMKEDESQLALALNKNGSVSVVGVGAASRIDACKLTTPNPAPDSNELAQCYPDGHVPGKVLFQQTYTVTVREGSLCADIVNGSSIYVYCSPPYPLQFVQGLAPH